VRDIGSFSYVTLLLLFGGFEVLECTCKVNLIEDYWSELAKRYGISSSLSGMYFAIQSSVPSRWLSDLAVMIIRLNVSPTIDETDSGNLLISHLLQLE